MRNRKGRFIGKLTCLLLLFTLIFCTLGGCNSKMLDEMLKIEGDSRYCFAHYDGFVKEGQKYDYNDYFRKELPSYSIRSKEYYGAYNVGNKLFVEYRYIPLTLGGETNTKKMVQLTGCFDLGAEEIRLQLLHSKSGENVYRVARVGAYMAYTMESMDEIWLYNEDLEKTTLPKNGHEWEILVHGLVEELSSGDERSYRIYDERLQANSITLERGFYFESLTADCVYSRKGYRDEEYAVAGPYSYVGYRLSTMEKMTNEEVSAWLEYEPEPLYDTYGNFGKYVDGEYVVLMTWEEMLQTSKELQRIFEINPNAWVGIAGVLYGYGETYMVIGNSGFFQTSCAGNVAYTSIYLYEGEKNFRFLGCAATIRNAPNEIMIIKLT